MENKYYAWCNNKNCLEKENCIRYSEDENIQYVNFEKLTINGKCLWIIRRKNEVVKVDE